ncbi:mitochondrial import inner membrane translocase subunit Tim23 isoform X2 [Dipodomys merriami]|uniref:mitochondrial import inner membrane translocase subunit Tim23 isoform X2 n=1 Tax=Dipodomys merriami TaxID=94247 RepID=UPI0038558240
MEGGGGSGNKTTGGLAGFFGASGAGYSHADLAGVPLTGMNPLSPYLNVDPRYLVQDTDEFILPTGANKTRGRFELAFFTIGGCCMTGAAFGAVNGLRLGLKETQNMAWSKPRNVQGKRRAKKWRDSEQMKQWYALDTVENEPCNLWMGTEGKNWKRARERVTLSRKKYILYLTYVSVTPLYSPL